MTHKKVFFCLIACLILGIAFYVYSFERMPRASNQLFALYEDGSIHEIEPRNENSCLTEEACDLAKALEKVAWIDEAFVFYETHVYHIIILGENIGDINEVLTCLEQEIGEFSISALDIYDNEIEIEVVLT